MNTDAPDVEMTASLRRRAEEEVSRAVLSLIRDEPFFGHVLAGINREFDGTTSSAGVSVRDGRPLLSIDPDFFVNGLAGEGQRVAVVKHELLHLLLGHASRFDAGRMNRKMFDLASDLVINQMIGKWPLPADAVRLDSFDFDLPPDQTVEWYHDKLMEHGEAVPPDAEPEHSDHGRWEESEGLARTIGQQEIARLAQHAKERAGARYGDTPADIQHLVEALIGELTPAIDWRRILRMFVASSRRTRISNTLRRPSKRYGTYPGIRVKRHHRLAVVVDTSGSIHDDLLAAFFAEVRAMWRQGSEVIVIEADASVRRTWTYRGQVPTDISGRGGTLFDPALQWVADEREPFDALIYLTDGAAPKPTVDPRCKVLWVVPEGATTSALDGQRTVQMPG